ncbi:MAG TPA: TonB-dependent receptor [Cyanobacteria bacterium UBA8543]|nr:TonB-dependent receptor [Cyanobacteria bacterium UBA8543]
MKLQPIFPVLPFVSAVVAFAAQPAWAQVTQVTDVRVEATPDGLQVILQTADGSSPQVFTSSNDRAFVADIANAQLRLPEGTQFRRENPAEGVTSIVVQSLDTNSIRVTVTGEAKVPVVKVIPSEQGLVFSLMPVAPVEDESTSKPTTEADEQSKPLAEAEEEIEVVVTATRTAENPQDIPRSVTVVTREQIQQQSTISRNLTDILGATVPGFSPPSQTNATPSLRGRTPAILIDGVPQSTNTRFEEYLTTIDPAAIERIEVVRGPSAIYGDGAAGGIINIITRRASAKRIVAETEVGTQAALGNLQGDSFGYKLRHFTAINEGDVDFTFSVLRATRGDAYDAQGDRIPIDSITPESETWNVLGKLGFNLGDQQRLQITFTHDDDEQDFEFAVPGLEPGDKARGTGVVPRYEGALPTGRENTLVSLDYTNGNLFGSRLQGQLYYRDYTLRGTTFDDRSIGINELNRNVLESEKWGGRLQIETPFSQSAKLLWGLDYSNEDTLLDRDFFDIPTFDDSEGRILRKTEERVVIPRYDLNSLGIFAQFQWDVTERFLLSGGIRHERVGLSVPDYTTAAGEDIEGGDIDFSDTLFNVGAVYKITKSVSVFANFAQGFSVPDFGNVLFAPPQGFRVEADLDITSPQQINNYEIGIRGNWRNVQASLAAFYNQSDLGTSFRLLPNQRQELVRAPERVYGFEATLDVQLNKALQLGSTLSWSEGEFDPNDDGDYKALNSIRISPLKLTAYVEHQTTPGWRNRLQLLFIGNRSRSFEDDIDLSPIESYVTVDYVSSIKIGPGTLNIGVENLLDNQYFPVSSQAFGNFNPSVNYAARGRTIGLSYTFSW